MRPLNIWFVAPECAPYLILGGVGTGLRGLVQALRRRGHTITIAIPAHDTTCSEARQTREIRLADPHAEHGVSCIGVREVLDSDGFRVLLFHIPHGDAGYGTDISTNPIAARTSGLFVRAVVDVIAKTHQSERIDVVHVHEWPAAMVPYLLHQRKMQLATVLTIHSLAHQGWFPISALSWFELGPEHATMDRLELYGRISLLKGGMLAADRITTVSPTYAREIQTPEQGELLDGVLRMRRDKLSGIVNGIDVMVWNPATDPALAAPFAAQNITGKHVCKQSFCLARGIDADRPLVVSLGRLVEQKGIDWLAEATPSLVAQGANVAIAGSGDPAFERQVASLAQVFPGRVLHLGHVTDEDARRLLAAADLLIMPSRWEPCGIVQLQALRYGALPVARRTGGLADTIVDVDERPEAANGFLFDEPSAEGVARAVVRAIRRLGTPEAAAMQRRGMLAALGWEGAARSYEAVYRAALG